MPYKDYKILEELKSGGTSQVYRVSDIETDELRVMKITSFQHIQKNIWLNEIQMLQKFQYVRGVVKLYEFGEVEDSTHEKFGYAVLELCDHDLFEEPVQEHERKKVFLFMYNLLTTIHLMGYCYCDLKPENILRKGKGYRLCDFSSCQPIGTLTNVMYGTPHVMAPEIIKTLNDKKDYYYDEKIDTWGLGCLLYELITQHEFDRHQLPEILYKVTDPYYKSILHLCLDPNPLTRVRVWELSKRMKDLVPEQAALEQTLSGPTPPDQTLSGQTQPVSLGLSGPHEPLKSEEQAQQQSVPVVVFGLGSSSSLAHSQQSSHSLRLADQTAVANLSQLHSYPLQVYSSQPQPYPQQSKYPSRAYPRRVRVYRQNAVPFRSIPLRKRLDAKRNRYEH